MRQLKHLLLLVLVACSSEDSMVRVPDTDRTRSVQVLGDTDRDVGRLVAPVDDSGAALEDASVEAADDFVPDAGVLELLDAATNVDAIDEQLAEFCAPFVGEWEWIMGSGITQCDGSPPDPDTIAGMLVCNPYCTWDENLWISDTCDVFAEDELTQERTLVYTGARLEGSVLHLRSAQQDDPEAKLIEMENRGEETLGQFLGTYTRPNSDCPDQVLSLQVRRIEEP